MKTYVTFTQFCDAWPESRKNSFSYYGKKALYDYLERLEEDMGEEMELDIIALDCDFVEYESAYDAMQEYQPEDMPTEGEDGDDLTEIAEKNEAEARRWLEDRTAVIDIEGGGVIIQQF